MEGKSRGILRQSHVEGGIWGSGKGDQSHICLQTLNLIQGTKILNFSPLWVWGTSLTEVLCQEHFGPFFSPLNFPL